MRYKYLVLIKTSLWTKDMEKGLFEIDNFIMGNLTSLQTAHEVFFELYIFKK